MKTFVEYQAEALKTRHYPNMAGNFIYPAMGLVGEAGEVSEKLKKVWRLQNNIHPEVLTDIDREEVMKELGDVLWYAAALCTELGVSLETVAEMNIVKLRDREQRGVIKGSGDNR